MDFPSKASSTTHQQQQQPQLHIIEKVEPTRVLKTCFQPLFRIMVPLGILPVHINEIGWATCKLPQMQSAFYVIFFGSFTFVTCIYAPFYLDAMDKMGYSFVFEVAKYLFVCGQHLTAAMTLLMIPILSGRVTKIWNKLQQLVVQITSCHSPKWFIRLYRITRYVMVVWIVVVVTSWYLWWKSFFMNGFFQQYFKSCHGSFSYFMHILGCIVMSTLISTHVLHSIFFISLASTLRICFRTIRWVARKREEECNLLVKHSAEQWNDKMSEKKVCCELVDAFRTGSKLVAFLGNIYGRYMVLEMFAFFSSALTSFFALFDNFDALRLDTVIITLVINITWFCGMCECGQMLLDEQLRCFESMKAIALRCNMPANWMIEKFVGVKLSGLTAANYFVFSRKLVTAAVVSLVTYLIVMLQFKAADKTNGLIVDSAKKIENLTSFYNCN